MYQLHHKLRYKFPSPSRKTVDVESTSMSYCMLIRLWAHKPYTLPVLPIFPLSL